MRYTFGGDPAVEGYIRRQIDEAVQLIVREFQNPVAIVLCGAFGRGEGTVLKDGDRVSPVNDYDFLVVSDSHEVDRRRLGKTIANALGMNLVDVGVVCPRNLGSMPPSQWSYDLKHGAAVIFGDKNILDLVPDISPEQIPTWDAVKLLCNRMAGILGAMAFSEASGVVVKEAAWFRVQLDHMLMSCGDALLITRLRYHHHYRERLKRFLELATGWCSESDKLKTASAYQRKLSVLEPSSQEGSDCRNELVETARLAERTYRYVIGSYLRREISSAGEAIDVYMRRHRSPVRVRLRQWVACLTKSSLDYGLESTAASPVHACYGLVPAVFFSGPWQLDARMSDRSFSSLRRKFPGVNFLGRGSEWERARSTAYELWERYCH